MNIDESSSIMADCFGDRFIPTRTPSNSEEQQFLLNFSNTNANANTATSSSSEAAAIAEQLIFDGKRSSSSSSNSKILSFTGIKAPLPKPGSSSTEQQLRVLYSQNKANLHRPRATNPSSSSIGTTTRNIPQAPERVLDAPEIVDDFYINVLDWSCNNTLAIALNKTAYLWNADTGSITELTTLQEHEADNFITSLSFIEDGSILAIGTNSCEVQLWDVQRQRQVRSMRGHLGRVGALSWNQHILSSGSRDTTIIHHDVRVAQHQIATLRHHQQEVCGLRWSPDGSQIASGSNDNTVAVWDAAATVGHTVSPRFVFSDHSAAVKALAWCPWQQNLLATGGGSADRKLRFFNTNTGICLNSLDTECQISSIVWSKTERELVTGHGFSNNQLCVWKYPSLSKVAELTGHTSRILHLALSPDGSMVCSAAGDETLRYWRIFPSVAEKEKACKKGYFEGTCALSSSTSTAASSSSSSTAGMYSRPMTIR